MFAKGIGRHRLRTTVLKGFEAKWGWYTPVILAVGRLGEKDGKFKTSLCLLYSRCLSQTK